MRNTLTFIGSLAAVVAIGTVSSWRISAQTAAPPQFEVASVKPNKSGPGRMGIGIQPGGRFTATNVTVRDLISTAYGRSGGIPGPLPPSQIIGGPGWISSERFDIVAKAESDAQSGPFGAPEQMSLMLRGLLADRFKLVAHEEMREQPIYELRLDRADRQPGPKLRPSTTDCEAMRGANRGAARGGPPPGPPPPGQPPPCGLMIGPGRLAMGGATLEMFANALARLVSRVVVDRTGLTGSYEAAIEFTPDQSQMPPGGPPPGAPAPPVDGPSLFTALKEQLGLKLESERAPVHVLVIDSIEQPTAD